MSSGHSPGDFCSGFCSCGDLFSETDNELSMQHAYPVHQEISDEILPMHYGRTFTRERKKRVKPAQLSSIRDLTQLNEYMIYLLDELEWNRSWKKEPLDSSEWDKGFYRPPPRFLQKGGVTFNRPDAERLPAAGCKSEVTSVKEEKDIKGHEKQLTAAAIGILFWRNH